MKVTTVTTDCIALYLDTLTVRGRAANTIRATRSDLTGFLDDVGPHPVSEYDHRAAYYLTKHKRVVAAKTTRRRMGTLRGFGRWLGVDNPLSDYSAPTPARQQPHPIPEGIDGVLKMIRYSVGEDKKSLVALCGLCGLRVSEAVAVTMEDFNFHEATLKVHGKGDRERVIPVSPTANLILANRLLEICQEHEIEDERLASRLVPLHERSARKHLTNVAEKAGLSRAVSSHDLRATFATAAYQKCKDLRAVQELLGHSDSKTTEVYTGVTMASMRAAGDVA